MTLHGAITAGQNHVVYNWQYADKSARESASGLDAADKGKLALQLSDNSLWVLTHHDPATWSWVGGGHQNAPAFHSPSKSSLVVPALGTLLGHFDIGYPGIYVVADGVVYWMVFTVTAGASDNLNVELGDDDFSGSPNVLYEIGEDGEGNPRWNPTADGAWEDRNAWGFQGLADGELYYRLTNNAATPVTVSLELRLHGRYYYVDPA